MLKQDEKFKTDFMDRYERLKSSENLIHDSIRLLCSLNSETSCCEIIKEFIAKIPDYKANDEDANTVKQILHEVRTKNREIHVALAALNYSYDVAAYKANRMWFMQNVYECFF